MICITGDTHGFNDIDKLVLNKTLASLSENDYLLITGDFGGVWDGGMHDEDILDYYSIKPYTTLFIDGNHENFDLLNSCPVEMWNGGKIHRVTDKVFHLMRGQVFNIDGRSIFTFGGGLSIDKACRTIGKSWWPEEEPSEEECTEAMENLEKNGFLVDYIVIEWLIQEFSQFADLDIDLWYLAFSDRDNEAAVQKLYSQVIKTGMVSGTPTVFLNYIDSNYMFDAASLDSYIEKIRMSEYRIQECPDVVIEEGKTYTAVLETEIGDIHVELFPDTAPNAVNSFIYLAESGWFDGITLVQSNDESIWNAESVVEPGYSFDIEYDRSKTIDGPGFIGIDSSSFEQNPARFFITDNIRGYYEQRIREDCSGLGITEEAFDKYVDEKILRFSKANTIFARIVDRDIQKMIQHLEDLNIIDIIIETN